MPKKMSKEQIEIAAFVVVLFSALFYLAWRLTGSGTVEFVPYSAKPVSTEIKTAIFNRTDYRRLTAPVKLPLETGTPGNPQFLIE